MGFRSCESGELANFFFGFLVFWRSDRLLDRVVMTSRKEEEKLVRNKTKSFDYAHPTRFVAVGIPI